MDTEPSLRFVTASLTVNYLAPTPLGTELEIRGKVTEVKKKVLFAFRGDPLCFIHVLLNGIDLHGRGQEGLIVIEGEAITLVPEMSKPGHFLSPLYQKAKGLGILQGACKACSIKLKVEKEIEKQGITLIGDMSGHASMGGFIEKGYQIITF